MSSTTDISRPGIRREDTLRAKAAAALGWIAYGLFYATAVAAVLGLPIGFAVYLVGFQS